MLPSTIAILNKLKGVKRGAAPDQWITLCPSHDDHNPSLSVGEGDGKTLLRCFAGCEPEQILAAIGLPITALFEAHQAERQKAPEPGVTARTWTFTLPDGSIAKHKRLDLPGGKRIWWERNGQKSLAGWPSHDLPLYEAVVSGPRKPGMAALIVEGEKAADAIAAAANQAGYVTFATVCGASVTPSDDVLREIAAMGVTLWPDNDAPGLQHMDRIAARLVALDAWPFWLVWPGAPPKGDAADFVAAGGYFPDLDAVLWESSQTLEPSPALPRAARIL